MQGTHVIRRKTLASITVAARTQDVPSWALQTVADALKIMGSSSALCRRHFKVRSVTALFIVPVRRTPTRRLLADAMVFERAIASTPVATAQCLDAPTQLECRFVHVALFLRLVLSLRLQHEFR